MLARNVPRGKRRVKIGLTFRSDKANRNMAPGGARSIGNIARCRHEWGARKYSKKAMRYAIAAVKMTMASVIGVVLC